VLPLDVKALHALPDDSSQMALAEKEAVLV